VIVAIKQVLHARDEPQTISSHLNGNSSTLKPNLSGNWLQILRPLL